MPEPTHELEFAWSRPQRFLAIAMAATTSPRQFFAQAPRQGGLLGPLSFFVLAQLVPALLALLLGLAKGQAPALALTGLGTSLATSLGMALVFTLLLHLACRLLFKSAIGLEQTLRVVCYSSGLRVLSFLPVLLSPMAGAVLAILLAGYIVYITWIGLQEVGGLGSYQAMFALLLAFGLMMVLWALVYHRPGTPQATPPSGRG